MNVSPDSPEQQTPDILLDKEEMKKEVSPAFREFESKLASLPTPEEKIAFGLAFMTASISQEGPPRFREFWDARKYTLECFKENINSVIRKRLWDEYDELTKKARVLKQLLEEQSASAVGHLDDAIKALESDVTNFETLLGRLGDVEFPDQSPTMKEKAASYNKIQRELNLLNIFASRMHGLRKEVIKTDMRMRFKTKFFKKMSQISELIFPKRKQLIDQISQEFSSDVEKFMARHFQGEEVVGAPYFALREEIKALQGMAKVLTLSSSVFNRTRLKLSECWDKIKVLEKEHKKEQFAKKQVSQDNRQLIETKIVELKAKATELPIAELNAAIEEIAKEMKTIELHRSDVVTLKDMLTDLREPHLAIEREKAKAHEAAAAEAARQKREKIADTQARLVKFLKDGEQMELEAIEQMAQGFKDEVKSLGCSKTELLQFERQLRQVGDLLADAKERNLMNLSEDDRTALGSYRTVLEQKKVRRKEVKDQIDLLRKSLSGSSLDFEKAFQIREQMDQEKDALEKLTLGIEELEEKIANLES